MTNDEPYVEPKFEIINDLIQNCLFVQTLDNTDISYRITHNGYCTVIYEAIMDSEVILKAESTESEFHTFFKKVVEFDNYERWKQFFDVIYPPKDWQSYKWLEKMNGVQVKLILLCIKLNYDTLKMTYQLAMNQQQEIEFTNVNVPELGLSKDTTSDNTPTTMDLILDDDPFF